MSRRSTVLLILIGIVGLGLLLWFALRGPSVKIGLASAHIDALGFRVKTSRVNSILGFYVWSETEGVFLWALDVGSLPEEPITYGELPRGAKQIYPKDGTRPRKIQPGERFIVEISYQYDTWMTAAAADKYFRFEASPEGVTKELGETGFVPAPKVP
jgi:hypothetical protein